MIYSQNEEELISIGQKLGRLLDSGDIIVLSGDLGADRSNRGKRAGKQYRDLCPRASLRL